MYYFSRIISIFSTPPNEGIVSSLPEPQNAMSKLFEKISFVVLLFAIALLPFVSLEGAFMRDALKTMLFSWSVTVSFFFYVLSQLWERRFTFTYTGIYLPLVVFIVLLFVSAVASGAFDASWQGMFFDTGTVTFFVLLFVFAWLVGRLVVSYSRALLIFSMAVGALLTAGFVSFLAFPFGSLASVAKIIGNARGGETLLGVINDYGILLGWVVLVFLIFSHFLFSLSRRLRALFFVLFILLLLSLSVSGQKFVWYTLGVISLVFLTFDIPRFLGISEDDQGRTLPRATGYTLVVLAVSFLMVVTGGDIANFIQSKLGIGYVEVRPSWQATTEVVAGALRDNPFFGVGPGRFAIAWAEHSPFVLNATPFWGIDFRWGVAFLPSLLAMVGFLGAAAFLYFLFSVFKVGARQLFGLDDPLANILFLSLFLSLIYFVAAFFFYAPGFLPFVYFALVVGMIPALLIASGKIPVYHADPLRNADSAGFLASGIFVVVLLVSLWGAYGIWNNTRAFLLFTEGRSALESQDIQRALNLFTRAASVRPHEQYLRSLSNAALAMALRLSVNEGQTAQIDDTARQASFRQAASLAITAAERAVEYDKGNYLNWLTRGRIYTAFTGLGINGAYDFAKESYNYAMERSPRSPQIPFERAQLELAVGNKESARSFLEKALENKQDFSPAVLLLTQIDVEEGNIDKAISNIENAIFLSPADISLHFRAGMLYYNKREYEKAIDSFRRVLAVSPNNIDAGYALALALYQSGSAEEALTILRDLSVRAPANQNIMSLLNEVQSVVEPNSNQEEESGNAQDTVDQETINDNLEEVVE